jgi:hypothetical protein
MGLMPATWNWRRLCQMCVEVLFDNVCRRPADGICDTVTLSLDLALPHPDPPDVHLLLYSQILRIYLPGRVNDCQTAPSKSLAFLVTSVLPPLRSPFNANFKGMGLYSNEA